MICCKIGFESIVDELIAELFADEEEFFEFIFANRTAERFDLNIAVMIFRYKFKLDGIIMDNVMPIHTIAIIVFNAENIPFSAGKIRNIQPFEFDCGQQCEIFAISSRERKESIFESAVNFVFMLSVFSSFSGLSFQFPEHGIFFD